MNNVNGLMKKITMAPKNEDGTIADLSFFNGLITKINMMPNNKEKAMEICFICAYCDFLVEARLLTKEQYNDILCTINEIDIFYKHFATDEGRNINSLLETPNILNPMYKDILNYANNYLIFNPPLPNGNINDLTSHAIDFLADFDKELLYMFQKCFNNGLYSEVDLTKDGGYCHRLKDDLFGLIVNYNTYNFYKSITTVHEMGHAYHYYLDRCYPNLIRNSIAKECISRIFEHLFILYLRENHLMKEDEIDRYERFFITHQLRIMNSVYIINKLIIDKIIPVDFFVDKMNANLSFNDYYNLSIIKPKDNTFQQYLCFVDNYYSYAFLLSQIIRENYIEDPEETKRFIKEIPAYIRELGDIDFINLFDKNDYLNATKKNISRVLSKIHYKK